MMDWFSVRLDQITIDFFDLFVMHGDCPGPQRLKLTLTWFKMCTMIKSYFIGFPVEKDGHPATPILIEVNSGPIPNSNPMCLCLQCDWFPLPLNSSAWHIARHLEPRADVPSKAESKQRAGPLPKRTMNWWNGGFFRGSQVLENSNCQKKGAKVVGEATHFDSLWSVRDWFHLQWWAPASTVLPALTHGAWKAWRDVWEDCCRYHDGSLAEMGFRVKIQDTLTRSWSRVLGGNWYWWIVVVNVFLNTSLCHGTNCVAL